MTDVPRDTGDSGSGTLWGFTVRNDTDEAVTVQICRRGHGGAVLLQVVSMPQSRDAGWGGGQHGGVRFTERADCVVKTDGDVHVELDWGEG